MSKLRIVVFASGSGSNLQSIIDHTEADKLNIELAAVVCNKAGIKSIERAETHNIPVHVIPSKGLNREEHEALVMQALEPIQPELLVFAGYMRLVNATFIQKYYNHQKQLPGIINIHPALLPSFAGVDGYGDAYKYGVKVSGITVHFIDGGMDTGPIIAQEVLQRQQGESLDEFKARGLAIEHQLFPKVIQWYATDRLSLDGRWVHIQESRG
jgi:phosphoribosylglycinamide formyltransferase 1